MSQNGWKESSTSTPSEEGKGPVVAPVGEGGGGGGEGGGGGGGMKSPIVVLG